MSLPQVSLIVLFYIFCRLFQGIGVQHFQISIKSKYQKCQTVQQRRPRAGEVRKVCRGLGILRESCQVSVLVITGKHC